MLLAAICSGQIWEDVLSYFLGLILISRDKPWNSTSVSSSKRPVMLPCQCNAKGPCTAQPPQPHGEPSSGSQPDWISKQQFKVEFDRFRQLSFFLNDSRYHCDSIVSSSINAVLLQVCEECSTWLLIFFSFGLQTKIFLLRFAGRDKLLGVSV